MDLSFDTNHLLLYISIIFAVLFLVFLVMHREVLAKVLEKGVVEAEHVLTAAEPLLSMTPLAPYVHIGDEALKAADVGVKFAEQLFQNGSGTADQRKVIASDYAVNWMKTLGIDVDARVAHVIDGAIEGAVYLLPPTKAPDANTNIPATG